MRPVIVESPYSGNGESIEHNVAYAKQCMLDALQRGESPFASHLLYTQVLNDGDPEQRRTGIAAGLAWGAKADATVVYIDHGLTRGMRQGIDQAKLEQRPIEYRSLRQPGVNLGGGDL